MLTFSAPSTSADLSENDIKIAFVYKFANLTRWPETAFQDETSPIALCVNGGPELFQAFISRLDERELGKRTIAVRAITTPAEVGNCQVLFLDNSEPDDLELLVSAGLGQPVLTLTDAQGTTAGGIIDLQIVERRLAFDVNRAVLLESGLVISPDLLRLARTIEAGDIR